MTDHFVNLIALLVFLSFAPILPGGQLTKRQKERVKQIEHDFALSFARIQDIPVLAGTISHYWIFVSVEPALHFGGYSFAVPEMATDKEVIACQVSALECASWYEKNLASPPHEKEKTASQAPDRT